MLWSTVPALLVVEALTVWIAPRAADAMSDFAVAVAGSAGVATRTFPDPFLWLTLRPMTFDLRHADWLQVLAAIAVCAIVVAVFSWWTAVAAPLRFFINLNALLVGGAALVLFLAGHVNYDSAAFSQLMLRTAVLTWLVIPVFVAFFASLFPFRFLERLGFMALTVAWDIPFSIVRYGCFVAILSRTGSIAMTDLYFVFGPLLDIVPVICLLSILLVRLARSLESRRAAWGLS